MKKNAKSVFCLASLLTLVMLLALPGCKEEPAKSSKNDIVSFEIDGVDGKFSRPDNNTTEIIYLTVPADSDLSALTPVITVSDGATVSPASDVERDFTNPVTYTVTAENGDIRHFTVTVTAAEKVPEGTLSLRVELIADGDEDVTVYGIPAGGIVLAVSEQKDLPNPNDALPNKITISADDHDYVTWDIDNTPYGGNNNIITIYAADYTLNQPHNITVTVKKNGVNYSENISFTVIR